MNIKILSAVVALTGLLAIGSTACKSGDGGGVVGGGGSGGSIVGGGGSGGVVGGGGSGGSTSCYDCACADDSPCKALCDSQTAGNLNFCTAGDTNGSQCGSCVADNCDGASLSTCE